MESTQNNWIPHHCQSIGMLLPTGLDRTQRKKAQRQRCHTRVPGGVAPDTPQRGGRGLRGVPPGGDPLLPEEPLAHPPVAHLCRGRKGTGGARGLGPGGGVPHQLTPPRLGGIHFWESKMFLFGGKTCPPPEPTHPLPRVTEHNKKISAGDRMPGSHNFCRLPKCHHHFSTNHLITLFLGDCQSPPWGGQLSVTLSL